MGLFDTVRVHSPLLDPALHEVEFQTKDMYCRMERYTITADGRLIHTLTVWEGVPEHERPYWGKPEWKDTMFRSFGAIKVVPVRDVDTHFHGDLVFYGKDAHKVWREFKARFTEGHLTWIEEQEQPPVPDNVLTLRPPPA